MRRAVFLLVALCACHPTIDFDLTQSGTGTIAGVQNPGPGSITLDLPQFQHVNTSNIQGFPSSRTAKDHIQSARAKRITLTATDPSGQTLSFIVVLTLAISAPGQPTRLLAKLSPFPDAPSADLELESVDLAPYLKADDFSISATAGGTSQRNPVTIRTDVDLEVIADVF